MVKISYRKKTKNIPRRYLSGLKGKEKEAQIKSIFTHKKRPKVKGFKSHKSGWVRKFEKKYGPNIKTYKKISEKTGIPAQALKAVVRKGRGAYYSSGSRPNQTAESWGKARMYSYIMGGPTRKIDHHITEKYNVTFP
tara:strand:- start:454 stop:864 length:411 start_codon:yes stop_codon:yes gene_type:complete